MGALAVLAVGLWFNLQQWRYQRALAAGNSMVASAVWPANAEAWRQRAEAAISTDPTRALNDAQRAVADDRLDWRNWTSLAEAQVVAGDLAAARRSMAQMARSSRGFDAHWRYANLLLLSGSPDGFWQQLALALAVAPRTVMPEALNGAWAASEQHPEPVALAVEAAERQAPDPAQALSIRAAFINSLLDRNLLEAARGWWEGALTMASAAERRRQLRSLENHYLILLVRAGDPQRARAVWQDGVTHGVFDPDEGPTAHDAVSNGAFLRPIHPSPGAFPNGEANPLGWWLCADCAPAVSWRMPAAGGPALDLAFPAGDRPTDGRPLAREWLLLDAGARCQLSVEATVQPDLTGIIPSAGPAPSPASGVIVLAQSGAGQVIARLDLPTAPSGVWHTDFNVPAGSAIYQLLVLYRRPLGQTPFHGLVALRRVAMPCQGGRD